MMYGCSVLRCGICKQFYHMMHTYAVSATIAERIFITTRSTRQKCWLTLHQGLSYTVSSDCPGAYFDIRGALATTRSNVLSSQNIFLCNDQKLMSGPHGSEIREDKAS